MKITKKVDTEQSRSARLETDPHNRLSITRQGKTLELPRFREVLDGRFKVDKNNSLIYHIKRPQDSDVPQQIKLSGNWSLDKGHNLIFTLDKWHGEYFGNKLTFKSEIIDAKANKLAFAVTTKDSFDKINGYILKLSGAWQADKYNRLTFNAAREKGTNDELTFQGKWDINKQNQIIYTYTKTQLKTKEKEVQTITLKGYWDILEKYRLLYVLNKQINGSTALTINPERSRRVNSEFDFRVSLGKVLERGLQYEIGIGASPFKKKLILFGEWKVNEKLGLLFEIPYENGKTRSIIFGAAYKLGKDSNLELRLRNNEGKDLSLDLKLSKRMLKGQGEIFLRAFASKNEKQILAGAGWKW